MTNIIHWTEQDSQKKPLSSLYILDELDGKLNDLSLKVETMQKQGARCV